MANVNAFIQTFSGGEFGDAMSARVGIEAYQASCELCENWFMLAQGPMIRRPALDYIGSSSDSTKKTILKTFEFDVGQNYLLAIREGRIDFYLNDGLLTLDPVTAAVSNGTFGNFSGWTDESDSGASASASGGQLRLTSNGPATAIARTSFLINQANTTHVLKFDVVRGPVNMKIGTSPGLDNSAGFLALDSGTHQIEFFPTTSGTLRYLDFVFKGLDTFKVIDNVEILTGTDHFVETPWLEEDLRGIFTAQDGDRIFMFHRDYAPRVLERRGHRSWSLTFFEPQDGPFLPGPTTITMEPSARSGTPTVTSSAGYFVAGDVGRLLRVTHDGQHVSQAMNSGGTRTPAIKVTGIKKNRDFTITLSGTWTGTVVLERSVGNEDEFAETVRYTSNVDVIQNDSYKNGDTGTDATGGLVFDASNNVEGDDDPRGRFDNITCYYRFAIYPDEWTSGTVTATLSTNSSVQSGVGRIIAVNSSTNVQLEVFEQFSRAGESDIWDISPWNDADEYPNVVAFANGRLWTARRRELWASVADDYYSFRPGVEDADAIELTLRSKSAEGIRWMRELDFLCVGTRNEEYVIRSTSATSPIGPATTEPTLQGEEGGAAVEAVVGGDSIVYVHRNARRVMQFLHNPRALSEDSYISIDLTRLNPEACEDEIINLVIQQEPERRIFAVLKSGIVKMALFRREEEIMAWGTMSSPDAFFEDVAVLREADVDVPYFLVRRNIGGTWVRMIERMKSEIVLNDEDMVHMDSMLETEIERPADVSLVCSRLDLGSCTVTATDDIFVSGDAGKVLWMDGGRITIDTFVNAQQISGTVTYPLLGKLDVITNTRSIYQVPPGRWGIATPTSSVTGLDHLEGETVHIYADMAYRGTGVVSSGALSLGGTFSRIFVGLNYVSLWKGLKLAYGASRGTAINQPKQVTNMGAVLGDCSDTIYFGDTPGKLRPLIKLSQAAVLGGRKRYFSGEAYEKFNGTTDPDPRIYLATVNPGPATVKAIIPNIQVNERVGGP